MAVDTYFNAISLMLHCDGINNSSDITDSSIYGHTLQSSNVTLKDAISIGGFADSSGYTNHASSAYILTPNSPAFSFGTGDYTLEGRFYFLGLDTSQILFDTRSTSNGEGGQALMISGNDIIIYDSQAGSVVIGPHGLVAGQFFHVAISRVAAVTRLFIDGDIIGASWADNYDHVNDQMALLGVTFTPMGALNFRGFFEEIRITKAGRYTAPFTPPGSAFSQYIYQIAGALNESLAAAEFVQRAYLVSNGTLAGVSKTASDAVSYLIQLNTNEPCYVTISAEQGDQWQANLAVNIGDKCFPTTPATIPYYFVCIQQGDTGVTKPVWSTIPGNTVADGTAIWQCVERLIQPVTHGPVIPA